MILLGTGGSEDVKIILLIIFFLVLIISNRKLFFKVLARLNKLIIPTFRYKDLSRLRKLDKLVIVYRYWVTRNSL